MASHRESTDIVSSPAKSRACPECQLPLQAKCHHGVDLDLCAGCNGAWFDVTELSAVLLGPARRPTAYTVRFDESNLRPLTSSALACPVCGTGSLSRAVWGNVSASQCRTCQGIWISASSIEQLRGQLVELTSSNRLTPQPGSSGWEVGSDVLELLLEVIT